MAGHPVVLHRITAEAGAPLDSAVTDEDGRFAFALPAGDRAPAGGGGDDAGGGADAAAGEGRRPVYLATARYSGVVYFGPAIHGDDVPSSYRVEVYPSDAGSGDGGVSIRSRTLVVAPEGGGLRVMDVVEAAGRPGRTLVGPGATGAGGTGGDGADAGRREPWWTVALPASAREPRLLPGAVADEEVVFAAGEARISAVIPPSGRRLPIGYRVPDPPLELVLRHPVVELEVLAREGTGGRVEVPAASRGEPMETGDGRLQRYRMEGLAAGDTVRVRLAPPGGGGGGRTAAWLALAAGVVLSLAAVWAWRRREPGPPSAAALLALLVLPAAAAAGSGPPGSGDGGEETPAGADTLVLRDDMGRTVRLEGPPRRVVSLVPAFTEILFALDAGDRVVGRTRYGVHPPAAREVPSVGEGMRPSLELVTAREPDLVLFYAGAGNRSSVERLASLGIPAAAYRHDGLEDLYRNVRRLGRIAGRPERARELAGRIRCGLEAVARITDDVRAPRVYYEVWSDPPITVGRGSYLDSLLTLAGGRNVFGELEAASPRVGLEAVTRRQPDVILLSLRGGEGGRTPPSDRPGWDVLEAVEQGRVRPVAGDLVHRLGPRLPEAVASLAALLHPGLEARLRAAAGAGCGGASPPDGGAGADSLRTRPEPPRPRRGAAGRPAAVP